MPESLQRNTHLAPVPAVWPAHRPVQIVIVGEAPDETEALEGLPFIGARGHLLDSMLHQAGINRADCLVTNVFTTRPPENDISWFFGGKRADGGAFHPNHGHLKEEYAHELARLKAELLEAKPNVVLALGATALWALCGVTTISKHRGAPLVSTLIDGLKVLPTYHPAYVMRQYQERPTVGCDLLKAAREAGYPEIRRPNRALWIEPTIGDLYEFEKRYMQDVQVLTYDIETDPWDTKLIRCIGLAPDTRHALVVPFTDWRKKSGSYWPTIESEQVAWKWVAKWLEDPATIKLAQNGLYDIQWLARFGIKVRGKTADTMLLHHSLQPELPKSLGFLGSLYTDEVAWKNMVSFKNDSNKKDGV